MTGPVFVGLVFVENDDCPSSTIGWLDGRRVVGVAAKLEIDGHPHLAGVLNALGGATQ